MTSVHPAAIVSSRAELAPDVEVGPYAVIGPGGGNRPGLQGRIACRGGRAYPHGREKRHSSPCRHWARSAGQEISPGEPSRLEIGDDNTIREFVTINRGTQEGGGVTRVGNDCWLMASVHIAHDCTLADGVIMANFASLAGHVHIGNHVTMAGFSGAHQFCRIGDYSFVGIYAGITRDVPPCVLVAGQPPKPRGVNVIGLRRHGFSAEQRANIERAYRTLYRKELSRAKATEIIAEAARAQPELVLMAEFLAETGRGLLR